MAFGDTGGLAPQLIITCITPATGRVDIATGDPVRLVPGGSFEVTNEVGAPDLPILFGRANQCCTENSCAIPVMVRGLCRFKFDPMFDSTRPVVDGYSGVILNGKNGVRRAVVTHAVTRGLVVRVDNGKKEVWVLL